MYRGIFQSTSLLSRSFLMRIGFIFFTVIFLGACAPKMPSDTELTHVFTTNESRFVDMERLCTLYSNLRSVRFKDGAYQAKTEAGTMFLSQAEMAMVDAFWEASKIVQMNCLWNYSKGEGKLVQVSFTAYAVGLSVSGRLKSITHVVGDIRAWKLGALKRGELRALPKENWFIFEPQD